jgi:hypothetical protein
MFLDDESFSCRLFLFRDTHSLVEGWPFRAPLRRDEGVTRAVHKMGLFCGYDVRKMLSVHKKGHFCGYKASKSGFAAVTREKTVSGRAARW